MSKGNILIAPLNWGLGHATRCIPIIKELLLQNFTPILASDGVALELLKKEFPDLICLELPSLEIKYSKKGALFKFKILLQVFKFYSTIQKEQKELKIICNKHQIKGIISDNRLGLFHERIPCVVLSHQINVFSGFTTWITSKIHRHYLTKYNECWVPDYADHNYNLSGKLAHLVNSKLKLKYIGILSRFSYKETIEKYDILVLLSGPEPQRTLLEKKMIATLKDSPKKVVLVKGKIENEKKSTKIGNLLIYNFLTSKKLQELIAESKLVISRSGYTTLMDLAVLRKKAFFIPTPGQTEQEYLAKRLDSLKITPFCKQHEFNLQKLKYLEDYQGLKDFESKKNLGDFFELFEGK